MEKSTISLRSLRSQIPAENTLLLMNSFPALSCSCYSLASFPWHHSLNESFERSLPVRLPTTFLVVPATQKVGGTGSRWDWGMNTIQNLVHGKQFRVLGVGRIAFRSIFSSQPDISSIFGNKLKFLLRCMCVFCMYLCMHCLQRPEEVMNPLELELYTDVVCMMWVLGIGSSSSARAASALTGQAPLQMGERLRGRTLVLETQQWGRP